MIFEFKAEATSLLSHMDKNVCKCNDRKAQCKYPYMNRSLKAQ